MDGSLGERFPPKCMWQWLTVSQLMPLEETYDFHEFVSPALNDPDFDAKPMVLLVGQYSTGKTSFIRYLLERDFPGIRIGPEPTTDSFTAVMYGDNEQVIPGNALVSLVIHEHRPTMTKPTRDNTTNHVLKKSTDQFLLCRR